LCVTPLVVAQDGGLSKSLQELMGEHVHNPSFDVSSDAFETVTAVLTSHKPQVLHCLNPNGDAASNAR